MSTGRCRLRAKEYRPLAWYLCLLIALFVAGCVNYGFGANDATVYYVPLGRETYMAKTIEDFEAQAYERGKITDRDVRQVIRLIGESTATRKFGSNRVRVKIVRRHASDIYLDNDGGVLIDGEEKAIDEAAVKKIKKLIERNIR